ncbi:cAMP-dependent protein kinase [Aureococcus anophagefferens]|nr:cAMP-dependent protein kinase [Aureococcus anophagefferens]
MLGLPDLMNWRKAYENVVRGGEQASPSGVEAAPERAPRPAIEVPPSDPGAGAADPESPVHEKRPHAVIFPATRDAVEVRAVPKSAASTAAIEAALRRSVVFEALTSEQAAAVAASMSAAAVAEGEAVIAQGDASDAFYVVETGNFEIEIDGAVVATAGPESSFGELGLIMNRPRAATVHATEDSACWAMDVHLFRHMLASIPGLDLAPEKVDVIYGLFEAVAYEAGEEILEDLGDPAAFLLITGGEVEVCGGGRPSLKASRGDHLGTSHLPYVDSPVRRRSPTNKAWEQAVDLAGVAARDAVVGAEAVRSRRCPSRPASSASAGRWGARVRRVKLAFGGDGRPYALKMLLKEAMIATDQTAAVLHERDVLRKTRHPFVLELHGVFHSRDVCYFLLEFVPGGELFSHIQDRGMAFEEARFLAAHVLDALDHVHAQGVVYRDLKPENILIDARGYARVVDFGFAKVLPADAMTYTILGTPEYLSPECVLGQGYRSDVDLWAFGVLVYEMLRGRSPFCPPNPDDTMAVFRLITAAKVRIPPSMDAGAALRHGRVRRDRRKRLGDQNGAPDIKASAVFSFLNGDWAALRAKDIPAPHVPDLNGDGDASKFDTYPEDMAITPDDGDQTVFLEFGAGIVDDPVDCA